ncbi:MAG: hypothetical protein ACI4I1_10190 [Oscillospiraceae bacterium]
MRVLVKESHKTVSIRIYGLDGEERTKEFFEKYFTDVVGVYETPDEERESYESDAVWTIEKHADFSFFAQMLGVIQKSIDEIGKQLDKGANIQEYTFNDGCFVI